MLHEESSDNDEISIYSDEKIKESQDDDEISIQSDEKRPRKTKRSRTRKRGNNVKYEQEENDDEVYQSEDEIKEPEVKKKKCKRTYTKLKDKVYNLYLCNKKSSDSQKTKKLRPKNLK